MTFRTLIPLTRQVAFAPSRLFFSTSISRLNSVVSATPPAALNEGEKHIYTKLFEKFQPSKLVVEDISGGCGSMYQVEVVSPEFKGLTMVKQHRLVNEALKEEIKGMHGIRLTTKAST
ncbi:bola protein [Lobosporangium transversale]|uniref:Bola protein n=1 Tax=Lobosporangium transversale TaxID=64571 RepID=A0A1Y2H2B4_9FUNG|nr:bola protein [Lobosporangium transversale]ORZ28675.1 bola protein [Lobosporangium transversale]|eukprot:XP_021886348.1 bola protein [Lobosporangium transversale]